MKRFVFATASALALAESLGPAAAADLSRPWYPTKVAPYNAAYDWSGFFAGENGGYGWSSATWSSLGSSFNANGGMVGSQLSYSWQVGHFVYGLEGDIDRTNILDIGNVLGCDGKACETKSAFLSTARGRVVVADRWLPYATGGLAVGNICATLPGFSGTEATNAGWTVGGGVKFGLAANWTAEVGSPRRPPDRKFRRLVRLRGQRQQRRPHRGDRPRRHQVPLLTRRTARDPAFQVCMPWSGRPEGYSPPPKAGRSTAGAELAEADPHPTRSPAS
jgi:outer membrane immunogenic protein